MNISDYCSELDLQLGLSAPQERMTIAVKMLAKAYKVRGEEIAIFGLDAEQGQLRFLWPEKLKNSGSVPLNAKNSLVARTAREQRGYLDNHFAKAAHGVIFEAFASDKLPIQKILSAPMRSAAGVVGVIQVSRKGAEAKDAGADFSSAELTALQKMAEVIAKHI